MDSQVVITQKDLMDDAKDALSNKWGLAVGTYFLFILLSMVAGLIPFAGLFIAAPFSLGLAIFSLRISRDEFAETGQIFEGFNNFGTALGAYFLIMLATLIGFCLLIVPGVIVAIGFSQTMYIIADNPKIGVTEAMQESWEMMDGYKMDYFVLGLHFMLWSLLCVLTCGIGFLWLMPWMHVSMANFYNEVSGYNRDEEMDIIDHILA